MSEKQISQQEIEIGLLKMSINHLGDKESKIRFMPISHRMLCKHTLEQMISLLEKEIKVDKYNKKS